MVKKFTVGSLALLLLPLIQRRGALGPGNKCGPPGYLVLRNLPRPLPSPAMLHTTKCFCLCGVCLRSAIILLVCLDAQRCFVCAYMCRNLECCLLHKGKRSICLYLPQVCGPRNVTCEEMYPPGCKGFISSALLQLPLPEKRG